MSIETRPTNRLTLADLPDQTLRERAKLVEAQQQMLSSHERKVAELDAHLKAARLALENTEAATVELEAAARTADERTRPQATANYGAHVLRVADLRKALDAAKAKHAHEMPEAESDLKSTRGYIKAVEESIRRAEFQNALSLYKQRVADSNLVALGEYVRSKASQADISLGDSWRDRPGLLGTETPVALGRLSELHLKCEIEDFEAVRAAKPAPPIPPLHVPSLANGSATISH